MKDAITSSFTEIGSNQSGIDFINKLEDNPLSDKNVLSYRHYFNGAGVGIADFNKDGLQDIFLAGNEVPNKLYINKGDFKFEDISKTAGINVNKVWCSGVSIVDINGDGFQDIYVCQQGPYNEEQRRNLFYINNGDLTFTESAKSMGLDDPNYSTQAAFFDFDKDGDLDCYVMNESKYAGVVLANVFKDLEKKENMIAASGKMFENVGNLKFKNITEKAGMLAYGYGLGLAISDLNGDNWPDVYVANDYTVPDFMYINQKDGTFKEQVKDYTRQLSYFGMGCDVADINNDGLVDIGVVDMAAEDHFRDKTLMASMNVDLFKYYFNDLEYHLQYMFNSLQLNNGNNTFSNIAALAGVLKSDWSWAAIFSDLNLDGHKDYYVTNGFRRYSRDNDFMNKMDEVRAQNQGLIPMSKREELYALMPEIKLKNKLYINSGDLYFDDSNKTMYHPDIDTYSYGAAFADFDNDGDQDIIVNNIDQTATLLKNNTKEKTSYNHLRVTLNGDNPSLSTGAKVKIKTAKQIQFQEHLFVRGYESSMEQALFFGLGNEESVEYVEVIWTDGNIQRIDNPQINQTLTIQYQKGASFKPKNTGSNAIVQNVQSKNIGVDFTHKENPFDDFEKEVLLPQRQSAFGPALATSDINNDGLVDFYVGGAKGQSGQMYVQNMDGTFAKLSNQPWENEKFSEDVDAIFIDPNQDGNMDLLVLSGGSGDFVGQESLLINRFYANKGNGEFFRIGNVLPNSETASYSVIAENIDEDPLKELLITGAAKPGKYPQSESTVILDYQNNQYVDITQQIIPSLNEKDGLIRDAVWLDLNNDGQKDLVTAGEWQNVRVFIKEGDQYAEKTKEWKTDNKEGWWRSIEAGDLDGDGDLDLIVGNVGKNFKQKASEDKPLYLYSNDFDDNGTLDCVLAKHYDDRIVPARGKECSTEQMPFISKKYESYASFASASIDEILGEQKIDNGIKLKAVDFNSYVLLNENGHFKFQKLPSLAQISPINDIVLKDVNKDDKLDIITIGNDYNTEYETPRLDAGNGLVLINKGGNFEALNISESGLYCRNDAKKIKAIQRQGKEAIIVANNNGPIQIFEFE